MEILEWSRPRIMLYRTHHIVLGNAPVTFSLRSWCLMGSKGPSATVVLKMVHGKWGAWMLRSIELEVITMYFMHKNVCRQKVEMIATNQITFTDAASTFIVLHHQASVVLWLAKYFLLTSINISCRAVQRLPPFKFPLPSAAWKCNSQHNRANSKGSQLSYLIVFELEQNALLFYWVRLISHTGHFFLEDCHCSLFSQSQK